MSYLPVSAINGRHPSQLDGVHVLTPFVERLATEGERRRGQSRLRCPNGRRLNCSAGRRRSPQGGWSEVNAWASQQRMTLS